MITACPDGGHRFGLMLLAALDSISNRPGGDTVWSQFDNDGPDGLPNSGDDDGDGQVQESEYQPHLITQPVGNRRYWGDNWLDDLSLVAIQEGSADVWRLAPELMMFVDWWER